MNTADTEISLYICLCIHHARKLRVFISISLINFNSENTLCPFLRILVDRLHIWYRICCQDRHRHNQVRSVSLSLTPSLSLSHMPHTTADLQSGVHTEQILHASLLFTATINWLGASPTDVWARLLLNLQLIRLCVMGF